MRAHDAGPLGGVVVVDLSRVLAGPQATMMLADRGRDDSRRAGRFYGGYEQSGIGREFSSDGAIASCTQTKQIDVRLG